MQFMHTNGITKNSILHLTLTIQPKWCNLLEYSSGKSILGRLVVFATTFIYEWGELARSHTKPKQGPKILVDI